jgi:hypothetical protein
LKAKAALKEAKNENCPFRGGLTIKAARSCDFAKL